MKKLILTLSLFGSLAAHQVFAQGLKFEGFQLGLNLNLSNSSSEANVSGTPYKGSDTASNLGLQLEYDWALKGPYILGLGGSVSAGELKSGTLAPSTLSVKTKDLYSLFLTPSYAIDSKMLAYGKLALIGATGQSSLGGNVDFDGFGAGVGLKLTLDTNWYGQLELMANRYKDVTFGTEVDKLQSNTLSLGVGYKF